MEIWLYGTYLPIYYYWAPLLPKIWDGFCVIYRGLYCVLKEQLMMVWGVISDTAHGVKPWSLMTEEHAGKIRYKNC